VDLYLSRTPRYRDRRLIRLGDLRSHRGAQTYSVRAPADLAEYRYVIAWCHTFNVGSPVPRSLPRADPAPGRDAGAPARRAARRHHPVVRLTHWVNVVAFGVMVASGLRIFNAYPRFARRGDTFCCWPWEGTPAPAWLTFGGWLAGARHWHFAMMWVLVANGLVYLGFVYLHGEWRDLVPRRRDPRDAWEMVKFYLFVRRDHPRQGKHNALQKGAYFVMPAVGALVVLTGLAIWKPVSLAPLTGVFGGFVWARYWHFVSMLLLVLLALVHVFMVLSVDPYSIRSMVTGGYAERLSPEARNARPLLPSPSAPCRTGAPRPARSVP
jgi:Ni/Fe-hydrogenase b-type cytochrome subunit